MSSDLERTATTSGVARPDERQRVGRFELREVLGGGGMGRVYLARDSRLSRDVALKLIRGDARNETTRERFEREATAMAQLSHPNLVTIYDVGSDDGELFIAMEYIAGTNLSKWLGEQRREWREVVDKFVAAGRGLAAAHDAGIVHRDFKPSNVLVSERGTVHVTDFGIALAGGQSGDDAVGDEAPMAMGLTAEGASVGTPRYMSPEQHLRDSVDARSDQWSLAVALTEALTGSSPFPGGTYKAIVERVTKGEPSISNDTLPHGLESVVRRAMARDRDARYPTMSAMLDDLEAATARRPRRWPWLAALAVTVVAGATAFAIAGRGSSATPPADAGLVEHSALAAPPVDAGPPAPRSVDASVHIDAAPTRAAEPKPRPKKTTTKKKKINWRATGQVCGRNHGSQTCINCCTQPGEQLMPYPDCGCSFDGDKWDREHGKQGVAPPLDPKIEWRRRKMTCVSSDENKSCAACCRFGDTLKPYPSCECYFDGAKWDREHGKPE